MVTISRKIVLKAAAVGILMVLLPAGLFASSYGPVFGLLGHNGRRLYLADAVEAREYAYELGPDGKDVRVGLTDAEREASRKAIREQIGEIAAWYRFTP